MVSKKTDILLIIIVVAIRKKKDCNLFFFFKLFIYLFILAALGLRLSCCMRVFSSCSERGLLFVAVCGLLIEVASLVAEHGL